MTTTTDCPHDMFNGDRMSPAEAAHAAGLALLLAFVAAFLLSSAASVKPPGGYALPDVLRLLLFEPGRAAARWGDLEARLRVRWSEPDAMQARPPGVDPGATVRQADVTLRTASPAGQGEAERGATGWEVTAWGTPHFPSAVSLRAAMDCGTPCAQSAGDLEQALRVAGVRYQVECEGGAVRHFRLLWPGRPPAFAAEYLRSGGRPEILLFWGPPPEDILRRDGCLFAST
ncbi:MAG TPA: hypothetical protein VFU53_12120 [Burkholderiales bacterium]|nr:hypothetical protein [Burkholderiales bacterium]